jgi:hypothetical protein
MENQRTKHTGKLQVELLAYDREGHAVNWVGGTQDMNREGCSWRRTSLHYWAVAVSSQEIAGQRFFVSAHGIRRRVVTDYSNVLGNKPKSERMQIYPSPDHFRRASESGWMRPFELAEYESYRNVEEKTA